MTDANLILNAAVAALADTLVTLVVARVKDELTKDDFLRERFVMFASDLDLCDGDEVDEKISAAFSGSNTPDERDVERMIESAIDEHKDNDHDEDTLNDATRDAVRELFRQIARDL